MARLNVALILMGYFDKQRKTGRYYGCPRFELPSLLLCKCSQLPIWLLLEPRRVQITSGSPFAVGDVFQAGGYQHEGRLSVEESADHAGGCRISLLSRSIALFV